MQARFEPLRDEEGGDGPAMATEVHAPQPWYHAFRLSVISVLFAMLAIGATIVATLLDPVNLLCCLIIYAAPCVLLYFAWWRRLKAHTSFDMLVRVFATGAVPGVVLAIIVELILSIIFFLLFFGNDLDEVRDAQKAMSDPDPTESEKEALRHLRHSARFICFLFINAFVVAALVEESIKLCSVKCVRLGQFCCGDWRARSYNPYNMVLYLLAAAMGFSTVENMEYVMGADLLGEERMGIGSKLLLAVLRVCVSFPIHCMCAALTGVMLARRQYSQRGLSGNKWALPYVLLPAVLLHGSFDAFSMVGAAVITNQLVALLVIVGGSLTCLVGGAIVLWKMIQRFDWRAAYASYLDLYNRGVFHFAVPGQYGGYAASAGVPAGAGAGAGATGAPVVLLPGQIPPALLAARGGQPPGSAPAGGTFVALPPQVAGTGAAQAVGAASGGIVGSQGPAGSVMYVTATGQPVMVAGVPVSVAQGQPVVLTRAQPVNAPAVGPQAPSSDARGGPATGEL